MDWINECVDIQTATEFVTARSLYVTSAYDVYTITGILIVFVCGSLVFGLTGLVNELYRQERNFEVENPIPYPKNITEV